MKGEGKVIQGQLYLLGHDLITALSGRSGPGCRCVVICRVPELGERRKRFNANRDLCHCVRQIRAHLHSFSYNNYLARSACYH